LFEVQEIMDKKFPTWETAIEKYGTPIIRIAYYGLPSFRLPCCSEVLDMTIEQAQPTPMTKIGFRLEALSDGKNIWYQYLNMGEV
jgi:hypothetical protein